MSARSDMLATALSEKLNCGVAVINVVKFVPAINRKVVDHYEIHITGNERPLERSVVFKAKSHLYVVKMLEYLLDLHSKGFIK